MIDTQNINSIFEEHRIFKSIERFKNLEILELEGGAFGTDENRFSFGDVIVGRIAQARFKISNNHKLPCDINIVLKSSAVKSKSNEIFELETSKFQIQPHGHIFAVVIFKPKLMQEYDCAFEASLGSG